MAGGFIVAMLVFILLWLLVILASLVFQVRLLFALPIAALEHQSDNVVRASWTMTRGHFWRLLGMTLLLGVAIGGVQVVLQQVAGLGALPLQLVGSDDPSAAVSATTAVLLALGYIVLFIFALVADAYNKVFQYLLYVDTHRRNRGEVKQVMGWGHQPMQPPYGAVQPPYGPPPHRPGGFPPQGPQVG